MAPLKSHNLGIINDTCKAFAQGTQQDDDIVLICSKLLNTICDVMQHVLRGVERWCLDKTLSVNPSKTEMILFTRRYKPERHKAVYFEEELKLSQSVKYLPVISDLKLSWKAHLDSRCQKAIVAFSQLRRGMILVVIRPVFWYVAVM